MFDVLVASVNHAACQLYLVETWYLQTWNLILQTGTMVHLQFQL